MDTIEFTTDEQHEIFSLVASILHLGNIRFSTGFDGKMKLGKEENIEVISEVKSKINSKGHMILLLFRFKKI